VVLTPLPIGDHGGDAPDLVTNPLFELKQARNSSRPTIVIARVSDNHYCTVAPRLPCCAGELCKMKGTLKEAWLILCDGCNEPIHAECCVVCTEVGVATVYFGMMKSYSTVRSRVVGKDDDDNQEDGGVAHQCPKCVLLKETADGRHDTVNNDGASPGPPEGLDSGEAGESEAEDGGEEIPANTYRTMKKWVVGTPCAYVDGCALVGANGK